jgi:hypothetical protein
MLHDLVMTRCDHHIVGSWSIQSCRFVNRTVSVRSIGGRHALRSALIFNARLFSSTVGVRTPAAWVAGNRILFADSGDSRNHWMVTLSSGDWQIDGGPDA